MVSKPQDFMLWLDDEKPKEKEQTVDEMKSVLFSIASSSEKKGLMKKKPGKKKAQRK